MRQLEREGGVTLLHRSTRKLALTEEGQRYHAQCAAMCAAAEQARAELAAARDAPSGELRMSATVGFARHVSPALGAMLAQYPSLRLRLLVDGMAAGFPAAARVTGDRFASVATGLGLHAQRLFGSA